jgi:hypothetical protein
MHDRSFEAPSETERTLIIALLQLSTVVEEFRQKGSLDPQACEQLIQRYNLRDHTAAQIANVVTKGGLVGTSTANICGALLIVAREKNLGGFWNKPISDK